MYIPAVWQISGRSINCAICHSNQNYLGLSQTLRQDKVLLSQPTFNSSLTATSFISESKSLFGKDFDNTEAKALGSTSEIIFFRVCFQTAFNLFCISCFWISKN